MSPRTRNPLPPLVTIGLPVYNAERHLRQAVDSLLAQTLPDFELILADNASDDGTQGICLAYARQDHRVRYYRHPRNIGAPRNWNFVLREARGEFFRWASGNDWCAPGMLELCVDALRRDPGAVLCSGRTELVDEEGRSLGTYCGDLEARQDLPADRYSDVRARLDLNNAQQALARTRMLRRTRLDRTYPGGDLVLTAELALYGRFLLLGEVLLFRRQTPGTFMSLRSPAEVQRIYNPDAARPMRLLRGRQHWDHAYSILRAPIPFGEKVRALECSFKHARWDRGKILEEIRYLWGAAPAAG